MSRIGARPPVTATRLQDAFDRRSFVVGSIMGGIGVLLA